MVSLSASKEIWEINVFLAHSNHKIYDLFTFLTHIFFLGGGGGLAYKL